MHFLQSFSSADILEILVKIVVLISTVSLNPRNIIQAMDVLWAAMQQRFKTYFTDTIIIFHNMCIFTFFS